MRSNESNFDDLRIGKDVVGYVLCRTRWDVRQYLES